MNLDELQDWLVDKGVHFDLKRVSRLIATSEIDNLEPPSDTVSLATEIKWERLILAGSILARSERRKHQEVALRIATGALLISEDIAIRDAAAVLLAKLANHRAVELGEMRNLILPKLDHRLGVTLRIENQRRRLENSILVHSTGEHLPVNSFQQDFWSEANNKEAWLSASAPTASGKTFLVAKWIVDAVERGRAKVVIYLAPTRALVSEVEISLNGTLNTDSKIEVTSLPLREKYLLAFTAERRIIFVLTQERVHLLANSLDEQISIDLLVVDEAHKIGDNQRGVVLQDAVERLTRANPAMRAVFVSPATQNPEELLADVPSGMSQLAITSDSPTILQNVIFAEQVPRKPKQWMLNLRFDDEMINLGILHLRSKPMGLRKRLAFIAAAVGERGGTLIYANGAAEAETIALLISQLIEDETVPDDDLRDLADLIRNCVHRQYQLATVIEKGVGFHYGNMPSLVRSEVERLFRKGKIKFLVCTSTLIEGVNLSCRTIVLRAPKKGKLFHMEPHDFWNLAGRAGRWGNEFQGNIICIDPSDERAWPNGVPARTKYQIRRETDLVLARTDELSDYLSGLKNIPEKNQSDAATLEHVAAYLLSTFLRLGSINEADFATRHHPRTMQAFNDQLNELSKDIEIPVHIIVKYPGVSALGLQRLLDAFRDFQGDIEDLLPASAESVDAYSRFANIMKWINQYVFPAFFPDTLIPLHALIVQEWLRGYSLATIIRRRTEYHERHGQQYNIARVIRGTMELIEQTARYRAPKYFAAYLDVAKIHLDEIDRAELIDEDIDIGVALEFGVSTQTLLSLTEIGLSRISAVALYEKIALDNLDREDCIRWVTDRIEILDALELPRLVTREIRKKVLKENQQRVV